MFLFFFSVFVCFYCIPIQGAGSNFSLINQTRITNAFTISFCIGFTLPDFTYSASFDLKIFKRFHFLTYTCQEREIRKLIFIANSNPDVRPWTAHSIIISKLTLCLTYTFFLKKKLSSCLTELLNNFWKHDGGFTVALSFIKQFVSQSFWSIYSDNRTFLIYSFLNSLLIRLRLLVGTNP